MNHSVLILAAIVAAPVLNAAASQPTNPVKLGTAGNYAILAKSGISTTGTTMILGDIGVSPIDATGMTGFGLVMAASGASSTSALVIGKAFASDYAAPTPAALTLAIADMQAAYTDAAGRAPDVTELGAGNIGGLTLAPGVYKWSSSLTIPTDVTLSGGPNSIWILQVAGTLSISPATQVVLKGGAQPRNIFWQVAGQTTLETTSSFKGIILDQTSIVMNAGASLNGRALAQTAVSLDSTSVTSQASTSLIDNHFAIVDSTNPTNTCTVIVSGDEFTVFGDVQGIGTAGQAVTIHYEAPQPTSAFRGDKNVNVTQREFSTIEISFDGSSVTGAPVIIEKCSVRGSANLAKLTGTSTVICRLDSLLALMSPAQLASLEAAFTGNSDVKISVNNGASHGSLTINCNGVTTLD